MNQFERTPPQSPYLSFYDKHIMGPVFLGHLIYYVPYEKRNKMRTFIPEKIGVEKIKSSSTFEFRTALVQPSMQLFELPPGFGAYKRNQDDMKGGRGPLYFNRLPPELPAYEYEVEEEDQPAEEGSSDIQDSHKQPLIHP